MLYLNLNPVLRLRGIEKPFSFLVRSGFSNHTAHYLLSTSPRAIRLDHLEKLCLLLRCVPNDIIGWRPDPDTFIDDNTPLKNLRDNESSSFDLKSTLMNLPLNELRSLSEKIHRNASDENLNKTE